MNSSSYRLGLMHGALLVALLLAGVVVYCHAQDWIIGSGLAKHLDGQKHCNSITTGLGLEHHVTENFGLLAGFYRNSNCRESTYAGGSYTPLHLGPVSVGALAGAVTGYKAAPVLPAAGLLATFDFGRYGLGLVYIPPVKDSGNVLWLTARVRW